MTVESVISLAASTKQVFRGARVFRALEISYGGMSVFRGTLKVMQVPYGFWGYLGTRGVRV